MTSTNHFFFFFSGGEAGELQRPLHCPFRITPNLIHVHSSALMEPEPCCLLLAEKIPLRVTKVSREYLRSAQMWRRPCIQKGARESPPLPWARSLTSLSAGLDFWCWCLLQGQQGHRVKALRLGHRCTDLCPFSADDHPVDFRFCLVWRHRALKLLHREVTRMSLGFLSVLKAPTPE